MDTAVGKIKESLSPSSGEKTKYNIVFSYTVKSICMVVKCHLLPKPLKTKCSGKYLAPKGMMTKV
jgi:hypothetical protein